MNNTDFTQLSQFVRYAQKRFDLSLLAGCFADARPQPEIPSRSVGLSLVLGEVVPIPSLLQLQEETKVPQWHAGVMQVSCRCQSSMFAVFDGVIRESRGKNPFLPPSQILLSKAS
jgi:hypothetical protein